MVVSISFSFGTFEISTLSEDNMEAIKIGKAAFLAPDISTSP